MPMELKYNIGASPISTIKLFSGEGSDNCATVRLGGEQSCAVLAGHNGNEPHLMSLEKLRTREPSPWELGEGRREPFESSNMQVRCKQLMAVQRSGGVREGSMSGSVFRRSREIFYNEGQTSTTGTSSSKSKVCWIVEEVRVLHSSDEAAVMVVERRRGTYADAVHRREGGGDGR